MLNIYSKYLSDSKITQLCGDENFIAKMLQVEIALAKVQGELKIIPADSALEISNVLSGLKISPYVISDSTYQNGIPTIALLSEAKKRLSEKAQNYLHWGATSQDIVDTANILIVKEVITIFENRLSLIIKNLNNLEEKHRQTNMVGRTRTQHAVPITFGQKVRTWYAPLERHKSRLKQLEPRVLNLQLAGAAGNLSVFEKHGKKVAENLAIELDLGYIGDWQTQRDGIAEFSSWLAMIAGSIGKMGSDILLMSQTEINEVVENAGKGGKSSTMPHKNNPVLSEAIVALSDYVTQLAGVNFKAMIHSNERDGSAWILEWLSFPQMLNSCGTILNHALLISQNIQVNHEIMKKNLAKTNGLVFSEKASFVLTKYVTREEAKRIVTIACNRVLEEGIHLAKAMETEFPDGKIEWEKILKT